MGLLIAVLLTMVRVQMKRQKCRWKQQVCSTWCCSLGTLLQQQLSALRLVVKVHSVALSVRAVLATGRVGQSPRVGTARQPGAGSRCSGPAPQ